MVETSSAIITDRLPEKRLYVVSGNKKQSEDIKRLMMSFYNIDVFIDYSDALKQIEVNRPAAVVVDDFVPPLGGEAFVGFLRNGDYGKKVPIVYAYSESTAGSVEKFPYQDSVIFLRKPCNAGELASSISSQVSSRIEGEWEEIEPVQKSALKKTLQTFNTIATLIEEGSPVPYENIKSSCIPLIEAVKSGNFKDLLGAVKHHDNYSYVHSLRVATLLTLFGFNLGIKGDDLMTLSTGGLLHDVGKMQIPLLVLNKPGKLTVEEFTIMKGHVNATIDFLEKTSDLPKGVLLIAAQHHEKTDGSGYPHGLKGAGLNELARMAAITDVFGALTDRRVYKEPKTPEAAMKIMQSSPGHLDQHLLSLFQNILLGFAMV
ncbi:MAG TPA: HD domain-containing protein [Rhodospirillales bacterium]|nr:HD domain-containing protein [Rhodospirillales bacterium]